QDGDGVCDVYDTCPDIPNPDQADGDHNGVGDACECAQPAPGRCIAGGGARTSDCLLEVNPLAPTTPNPKGTGILGGLRCVDGDPVCDLDGQADGQCTFGVALCLANRDPRLTKCKPAGLRSFEVMAPDPDRARSTFDRANAIALEQGLGHLGVGIRRRSRVLSNGAVGAGDRPCSPVVHLVTPASAGRKAGRRTFQLRGVASDGRIDTDRLTLECQPRP